MKGFDNIWSIVWQENSLFHWITLFIFLTALTLEIVASIKYWQSLKKEEKILKAISKNQSNPRLNPAQNNWVKQYLEPQPNNQYRLKRQLQCLIKPTPSQLRFATTLCTAFGVLGTFYGIQESLQGIDFSNIDSDILLSKVEVIVNGMGTAFSTSLFGLGSSSVLTLIISGLETYKRLVQQSKKKSVLSILDRITVSDQSEGKILDKFDRLINSLEVLDPNRTTQALENVARSLAPDAIGAAVGQAISTEFDRTVKNQLVPVFAKIEKNHESLITINHTQKETLDNLIQNMRLELIEPVTEELRRSAALTEKASAAITQLNQDLGEITINLGKSVDTIREFQQETLIELNNFANSLKGTLEEFRTETTNVLKQTSETIDHALQESICGLEAQREMFDKSSTNAAKLLKGTSSNAAKLLNETAQKAIELMDNAGSNLKNTLENIDESLQKMRITAQEELESFRVAYQEELVKFFESQNQLLEGTLGKQRDALKEVVDSLKEAFETEIKQRQALVDDLEKTMATVKEGVKSVGSSYQYTHEKVINIHKLSAELNANFDQRIIQLDKLSEYVGKASKEQAKLYQEHIEASTEWQKKFFKESDLALSQICGHLVGTADLLLNSKSSTNGVH